MEESKNECVSSPQEIKHLLLLSYMQCSQRGLVHSANWAIELSNSLNVPLTAIPQLEHSVIFTNEYTIYHLGKSMYDLKKYHRAAHTLRNCISNEAFFLRLYSLYLAGEQVKADNEVEVLGNSKPPINENLQQIKLELAQKESTGQLDGYGYYLYGVVLRSLEMIEQARNALVKACSEVPLLWAAWQELYKLCDNRGTLYSLTLPNHWMKDFFLAAASLELMQVNDALSYYNHLMSMGFDSSTYIRTQLALVYYHQKEFRQSAMAFGEIRKSDPYNFIAMDTYSHVLFVLDMIAELYQLALEVESTDKYRPETCSIIGNFYSLNGDHEKACTYFKRSIRLDKTNHTSWILLGHECVQLQNHSLAIDAYTKALETNKHDFRGPYGLGHAYELLKMPFFAVTYYKMAQSIQPFDSRVLFALGNCYDQLEQYESAKKCYRKSIAFGEVEGTSIINLSKLLVKLGEHDEAAKLYTSFLAQTETKGEFNIPDEEGNAHVFLAKYFLKKKKVYEAEAHAHKAREFPSVREEGKSLLQEIHKHHDTLYSELLSDIEQDIPGISSKS